MVFFSLGFFWFALFVNKTDARMSFLDFKDTILIGMNVVIFLPG